MVLDHWTITFVGMVIAFVAAGFVGFVFGLVVLILADRRSDSLGTETSEDEY